VPPHFSWVDHRLIRHHRLRDCDHSAWALYLFLVSVGDAQGLSYYSDASLARALKVDLPGLSVARRQLIGADLIAYQKPLYQVLDLVEAVSAHEDGPASAHEKEPIPLKGGWISFPRRMALKGKPLAPPRRRRAVPVGQGAR
jgi:hypothetical protein